MIKRIDQKLLEFQKPPFKKKDGANLTDGDLFIVCAGFEKRTVNVIENYIRLHGCGEAVIIKYLPGVEDHYDHIIYTLNQHNIKYTTIVYNRFAPFDFTSDIKYVFDRCDYNHVFVDISAMSKFLIVQTIYSLAHLRGLNGVELLYSKYPDKGQSMKVFEEGFSPHYVSVDVSTLIATPQLSTITLEDLPTRLIAFYSKNSRQITALDLELQPCFTHLVLESLHEKQIPSSQTIKFHPVSGGYAKTMEFLILNYQEFNVFYNVFIAPIGTKSQAVAVALLKVFLDDIQIVYPVPMVFNANEEPKSVGVLSLDLSSFSQFSTLKPDSGFDN